MEQEHAMAPLMVVLSVALLVGWWVGLVSTKVGGRVSTTGAVKVDGMVWNLADEMAG